MYDWHTHGWMMWWLWIPFALALVWLLAKLGTRRSAFTPESESAIEILKKRLARGEITAEEFEKLKNTLDKD